MEGHPEIKSNPTLGRVYTVHPLNRECFFLRILLHNVRGPTSFKYLKTVDGEECETYHMACLKLGLLEEDCHWDKTLEDAQGTMMPRQMRDLFAILLSACELSNPKEL